MDKVKGPVTISSEIMHGEPVFTGIRVPIKALFDTLEGGESVDSFLEGFPSVKREQALEVLTLSSKAFWESLHAQLSA